MKQKTILVILLISLVGCFLYFIRTILLPFFLSAVLTYFLTPFISYLHSFGIKRVFAVLLLYIVFIVIFISAVIYIVPRMINEITVLKKNIPYYIDYLKGYGYLLQYNLEIKYPVLRGRAIIDTALKSIETFLNKELTKIPKYLLKLFSIFSVLVLIPILTFFFLLRSDKIGNRLIELVPAKHVETTLCLICEIDESLGKFIRTQLIETTAVGFMSFLGLLILGIDYALLIGLIAGIANIIPYMGPVAGTIPGVIVGVLQYGNIETALKVIIMFVIIQFIDNNFVQPIIMSKGVQLHPVVIIFAIMAGAELFGIIGMLFAVPIASVIKTVCEVFLRKPGRA